MPTPVGPTITPLSETRDATFSSVPTPDQQEPSQETATSEQPSGDWFLEVGDVGVNWEMLAALDRTAMQLIIDSDTTPTQPQQNAEPMVVQFFQGANPYQAVANGSGLPSYYGPTSAVNRPVSTFEQQENDSATASESKKKRPKRKPAKFQDGLEEGDYEDRYTQSPQDVTWNPAQEEAEEPAPKKSTKKKAHKELSDDDKAEKNRQSARDSRKRKKAYIKNLEGKVERADTLTSHYEKLQLEYARLKSQAESMALELAEYRGQYPKLKPS